MTTGRTAWPDEYATPTGAEGSGSALGAQLQYLAKLSRLRILPEDPNEPPTQRKCALNADGTLRGWKIWLPTRSEATRPVRLSSPIKESIWPRGVFKAECPSACGAVASRECHCGIYAYSDPGLAKNWIYQHALDFDEPLVVGEVAGWGRVSLHTTGWRAERVLVTALWSRGLWAPTMTQLGNYYEVTVRPLDKTSFLGL